MTSQPERAPHYSPVTRGAGLIFTSGQLPLRPGRDTSLADASFKEKSKRVNPPNFSVLSEAGADLAQVVKTTVYLSDMADWPELDEVYGQFFGAACPARSVVPTGPLHFGFRIEIEAIALASH